ncbi:hypothetical protein Q5H92_18515 [Hymenobacter sp. M29]|uniref:DUF4401 domain-containing protein n=1 Tax=Hymenobacter mellowenesis TaxID=3063995 RepID=A0ABT9AES5_9BACT|nr:hypothetical protein [Hymenobacter sp. M29]MDO7848367.1 hypothetical protein [Hymenobacter sp. M29]
MKIPAYNTDWAFNAALRGRVARWQRQQLVGAEQRAAIEAAYPLEYYQPAWPLRVGLFVFTCIGLALASGFSLMITGVNSPFGAGILFCAACFVLLEFLIKEQRFYHAGVDNALLYSGLASAAGLIYYAFSEYLWPLRGGYHLDLGASYLVLLLVLALLAAAALRYADALVTAAACLAALLLVALFGLNSQFGQMLLPFIMMAAAGGLLLLYRRLAQRLAGTYLADYYANCLLTLKVLGLVVLYLAGNYLVVREGNAELHHQFTSSQIPFAPVFYALTAGIPLVYIVLGLRRADRTLLLLGLLALAFSLFTLRHYRSLLPPEVAAVAAGVLLTALASALLRALRPARFGLTSLPDDEPRHFNLENLIQAQTAHAPDAPSTGGFEFGGGHSGGGGATGQF